MKYTQKPALTSAAPASTSVTSASVLSLLRALSTSSRLAPNLSSSSLNFRLALFVTTAITPEAPPKATVAPRLSHRPVLLRSTRAPGLVSLGAADAAPLLEAGGGVVGEVAATGPASVCAGRSDTTTRGESPPATVSVCCTGVKPGLLRSTRCTPLFFNPPIDRDQEIPPLSLSTLASRGALLGQLGADVARGDILVTAQDCQGKPAAGVSFSVTPADPEAIAYYLVNGLPTSGVTTTDSTGYGGFMNLSTNATTVTATLGSSKTVIGTLGLVVRGGSATWSRFAFKP